MKSAWASIQWLVFLIATNTIRCQAVQRRVIGVSLPENRGKYLSRDELTRALHRAGDGPVAPTIAPTVAPAVATPLRSADGDNIFDPEDVANRPRSADSDDIFDPDEMTVINSENQYLAFCQEHLLSDNVAGDGLISQKDIANFAKILCGIFDDKDLPDLSCPAPEFTNLSVEVQFLFVWFICPQDDDLSVISCLIDFVTSGFDFGYELESSAAKKTAAANVLGFCCSLIPNLAGANLEPLTGGEFRFLMVVHLHAFYLPSISHPA